MLTQPSKIQSQIRNFVPDITPRRPPNLPTKQPLWIGSDVQMLHAMKCLSRDIFPQNPASQRLTGSSKPLTPRSKSQCNDTATDTLHCLEGKRLISRQSASS